MEIETDSKDRAISACWRNQNAPQLKRVRPLSVQTETPEGGVVVRVGGHFGAGCVVHLVDARGGKRPFIVSPFDQFMNE